MDILHYHASLIIDGFAITEHRLPENKPERNEQRVHMGCDAEINLAVSHKASQRRSVCVCVCGNIYTLNSRHVERMCSVKICKLICQSDQRGKGKKSGSGSRNTHAHTYSERPTGAWPSIPIEISHSQTGCGPKVGGFALETAPAAIFGP